MRPEHTDANQSLLALKPLISTMAARRLSGWPDHVREDIEQSILVSLWQRVLPKYDPAQGPLERFARTAIRNLITDELRRLAASKPPLVILEDELSVEDDDPEDARLADAIRERPERFLPPSLVRIYNASQSHPTPGAAATSLGMEPTSYYRMSQKLKEHLRKLFRSQSAVRLRNAA